MSALDRREWLNSYRRRRKFLNRLIIMLYSIINTKKGEEQGFLALSHRMLSEGNKMIVNENELRLVDEDIIEAVKKLGGTELLTNSELHNIIKASKIQ